MTQLKMSYPSAYRPSPIDLSGTFLRRTDLNGANLTGANLSRADFTKANFRGADFRDTNLEGTILQGADLTDARNLTRAQLAGAIVDEKTILPGYLSDATAGPS